MTPVSQSVAVLETLPPLFEGWTPHAPREEIAPRFSFVPEEGKQGQGVLLIEADSRAGLDGWWQKTFPVVGGKHFHFSARYRAESVENERRSVVVKIDWWDSHGKPVLEDKQVCSGYLCDSVAMAETEHPQAKLAEGASWTEVSETYRVPTDATHATVELHLQWSQNSRLSWSNITFSETEPPPKRIARLATVHFQPRGGETPEGNCRLYEPLIAEAAKQRADLVVLGETLTLYGLEKSYVEAAEPIPGPSTDYFGTLAKRHNLYIVAGLVERAGHLVYNTAVLLGPEGEVVGKYRKVCLPRTEIQGGVTPGTEYPVFDTRFGKIGMMICYDGFFPEVAMNLAHNGAEVIAWPVWGCNPLLASARACENHIYLVSSTYEDISRNWMVSAIYNHEGKTEALASRWGTVAVAEVDLSEPTRWVCLGSFKDHMHRHRPLSPWEQR